MDAGREPEHEGWAAPHRPPEDANPAGPANPQSHLHRPRTDPFDAPAAGSHPDQDGLPVDGPTSGQTWQPWEQHQTEGHQTNWHQTDPHQTDPHRSERNQSRQHQPWPVHPSAQTGASPGPSWSPEQPWPQDRAWPAPAQGYGGPVQPYPGVPAGPGVVPAPLRSDYAHWGRRVAASLIDGIPGIVFAVVLMIGYIRFLVAVFEDSVQGAAPALPAGFGPWMVALVVLYVIMLGWSVYDRWLLQGRTGQTLGKRVLKIRLINEANGAPIGAGMAFARDLVHYLDGVAYVGYLWPLWDEKRQTFADKLLKTVVVDVPENTPITLAKDRTPPEPFR
ncbi:putative RDD family membrane protein YckC [Friedmanniella endophytica]|uniref:Putative RDD family membrane protein YckC n=1 Tax=Microlunatus kandeliicorticis TaxID=1759536 RepID=A0A7W3IUD5_9ACTN|nr:RDD family protein [Microlunatus kandeliicorticis]MBA8795409.1 putative RDD family membrane protein YckC [Microlunatus kandeliicorticis]